MSGAVVIRYPVFDIMRKSSTGLCGQPNGFFVAVVGQHLVGAGNGGSIINIGSMSGVVPLSRVFTYSATKSAVHNLSLNLAREWAPRRVRVNVLVPGFFPAEQNRKILQPERIASIMTHTPMARFGGARELIGATLLLASDTAARSSREGLSSTRVSAITSDAPLQISFATSANARNPCISPDFCSIGRSGRSFE